MRGTVLLAAWMVAGTGVLLAGGCQQTTDRWSVAGAGQGAVGLRREEGPPVPPPPAPVVVERIVEVPAPAPTGPSAKEIELQKKIDAMEVRTRAAEEQSKAMKAELERLKAEKAGGK